MNRTLIPAVGTAVALMVTPISPVAATPSEGVDGVVLSQSTYKGKDYITRELTIAPGGSTGWHYHPGQIFGVVRSGTLTHYEEDCTVDGIYQEGQAISERSGPGYIHEGRNEGTEPLVLWVLYIDPAGSQLAVDMPNAGCGF